MTKVKICGLKSLEDIAFVNALKPDYIGFVFAKSPRQVTREQAQELKCYLSKRIKAVGVFVREEVTQVAKIANADIIDMIQLHGDETPEFCRMLRKLTAKPVIKVIRVKNADSLINLEDYDCDYFLLDTYSAKAYGGVGQTFALPALENATLPKPFFVAGGLTAANVRQIIGALQPFGVDTSGGVETEGKKDFAKIAAFLAAVREREL